MTDEHVRILLCLIPVVMIVAWMWPKRGYDKPTIVVNVRGEATMWWGAHEIRGPSWPATYVYIIDSVEVENDRGTVSEGAPGRHEASSGSRGSSDP